MNKRRIYLRALPALLAAAGCMAVAAPASAETVEGVTVEAARVVVVGRTAYGAPEQQVVLRRGVTYADLDLSTDAGKATLETRIRETAADLCKELDKMYPLQDPKKADCVHDAVKAGMAQAAKVEAKTK